MQLALIGKLSISLKAKLIDIFGYGWELLNDINFILGEVTTFFIKKYSIKFNIFRTAVDLHIFLTLIILE